MHKFRSRFNIIRAFCEAYVDNAKAWGIGDLGIAALQSAFQNYVDNPYDEAYYWDIRHAISRFGSHEFFENFGQWLWYLIIDFKFNRLDEELDIENIPARFAPYLYKWIWFDYSESFPTEEELDATLAIVAVDNDQAIAFIEQSIDLKSAT